MNTLDKSHIIWYTWRRDLGHSAPLFSFVKPYGKIFIENWFPSLLRFFPKFYFIWAVSALKVASDSERASLGWVRETSRGKRRQETYAASGPDIFP